jgi:hypothetical protein
MPISVAASRSWAVARRTRPVCVHFMKAKSRTVRASAMTKATTWERLKAVPPRRRTTEACHGRTKRKSPVQATRAAFWSTIESPTVVKIWTLWEAVITPRMTRP